MATIAQKPQTLGRKPQVVTTSRNAMPPVSTVYRGPDGSLHHSRCASRMDFQGRRAGLELDFYCLSCCEHITLTPYVLMRLA